MSHSLLRSVLALALCMATQGALAQCPATVPAEGAVPAAPLPVFPSDNWWNTDISAAPVDPGSVSYIAFVNDGGVRRLHPDFGGEESQGSVGVYGMPYVVVNGAQPKVPVTFDYWDESDGVDSHGNAIPFYPIPAQAASQAHWIEGGAPGNVDQRDDSDRHLIVIDCSNRYLYELYNVYYDAAHAKWLAGSGAFFDMNANNRRPDGWTSADAAGLAIFPGLVRYDEAWNPGVTDIGHAFRVTVRSTNGYVYPASHRAGSTPGALPMGARLRLRASVNGADPALRTSDPNVRKIFRAMQKYGLLVADNGSDMFITGTFDTRWNNDILNPAFALLSASDFEVVQLGWKPTAAAAALAGVSVNPVAVIGGNGATGTVTLTLAAPAGGATVSLSSAGLPASVPATVAVVAGATSATFAVTTGAVETSTLTTLTATYRGTSKTATLRVDPPAAAAPAAVKKVALSKTSVIGGRSVTASVILTSAAPAGGIVVNLRSLNTSVLTVPAHVTVPAGATSQTFTISTLRQTKNTGTAVYASYAGTQQYAVLKVLTP